MGDNVSSVASSLHMSFSRDLFFIGLGSPKAKPEQPKNTQQKYVRARHISHISRDGGTYRRSARGLVQQYLRLLWTEGGADVTDWD